MGCAVNGPGEARDADIGIAGGKGEMLLFRKGEPLRKVPEGEAVAALMAEVDRLSVDVQDLPAHRLARSFYALLRYCARRRVQAQPPQAALSAWKKS